MAEAKSARGRIPLNGRIMLIVVPPHIIKCFLLKIQGFSTFYISVNRPQLQAFPCIGY